MERIKQIVKKIVLMNAEESYELDNIKTLTIKFTNPSTNQHESIQAELPTTNWNTETKSQAMNVEDSSSNDGKINFEICNIYGQYSIKCNQQLNDVTLIMTIYDEDKDYEGDMSEEKDLDSLDSDPYIYDLDTYSDSETVGDLIKKFKRNEILIPNFQRPYVWDHESKNTPRHKPSLFIDSVLLGLPIPSIVLYRDKIGSNAEYLVVDGQQRLKTLAYFKHAEDSEEKLFDMGFTLHGSEVNNQWNNKTYNEILDDKGETYIDKIFNERRIPVVYIRQVTPSSPDRPTSMYKLFDRLNSGGMELHAHEIRMALSFQKEYTHNIFQMLKDIDSSYKIFWESLLPISYFDNKNFGKRMELFFRLLVCSFFWNEYKRPLRKFLDDMASKKYEYDITYLKEKMNQTVNILITYYQNDTELFRPNGRFNFKLFETVFAGLFVRTIKNIDPLTLSQFSILFDTFKDKGYHETDKVTNETLFKLQYDMAIQLFTEKIQSSELVTKEQALDDNRYK